MDNLDNYIVLNGKKIKLTDVQSNMIQMMVEDGKLGKRDIFDRVDRLEDYYYIDDDGKVVKASETRHEFDESLYYVANYCSDKSFITKRSYDEVINRLLWRYAYRANGGKLSLNGEETKYTIIWNDTKGKFEVKGEPWNIETVGAIYFKNLADAYAAIEGITVPFCEKFAKGESKNG